MVIWKKIFNFKKKYIDQILRTLDSRGRTLQHAACSASNQHQDCSMKVVLSHFTSVKILHRSAKIFLHLRSQQCRHQTGHRTWTSAHNITSRYITHGTVLQLRCPAHLVSLLWRAMSEWRLVLVWALLYRWTKPTLSCTILGSDINP